jgi:cysteine desulfuration protein SufE
MTSHFASSAKVSFSSHWLKCIMPIAMKHDNLISDLNLIHDPHERLAVVMSRAASRSLADQHKNNENQVAGCVSRVWLVGTHDKGVCRFQCDADSPLVKGLVALLCDLYSGATLDEAAEIDPEIWNKCGFDRLLSPTRVNGLRAVRARIRELALGMKETFPAAG